MVNIDTYQLVILAMYLGFALSLMLFLLGLMLINVGMVNAKNTIDLFVKFFLALSVSSVVAMFFADIAVIEPSGNSYSYWPQYNFSLLHRLFLHPFSQIEVSRQFLMNLFFYMLLPVISLIIVIAATAERMKFWSYFLFMLILLIVIFPFEIHWIWGGGFLRKIGFIDVSGAACIHLAGATAALCACLMLGPRHQRFIKSKLMRPFLGSNLSFVAVGSILIWLGAYGVNFLRHPEFITMKTIFISLLNTNISIGLSIITAVFFSYLLFGIVDISLLANSIVMGVVVQSAAPTLMNPATAACLGIVGTFIYIVLFLILPKMRLDDITGSIGVHAVGGIVSLIAVSFMPNVRLSLAGTTRFTEQLLLQCYGIFIVFIWVFFTSLITLVFLRLLLGLKSSEESQIMGLDLAHCGMSVTPELRQGGL